MKHSIFLIGCLCIITCVHSQSIKFNNLYDNHHYDNGGLSVIQTSDGYYLVGGADYGAAIYAALLIKIDSTGNTIWQKDYDFELPGGDDIHCVIESNDYKYVACGVSYDTVLLHAVVYSAKWDTSGNLIWYKTYGGLWNEYSEQIKNTYDGGYIIAGSLYPDSTINYLNASLAKIDSAGNLQWKKQYGGIFHDEFYSVLQLNDSGYIAAGYYCPSAAYGVIWLVRTDANGDTLWTKHFIPNIQGDLALNIDTCMGGYILCGGKYHNGVQDAYYARTDTSGNVIWQNSFLPGQTINDFYSIHQLNDGNFITAGTAHPDTSRPVGWLMKINGSTGDSIWSHYYQILPSNKDQYITDMKITDDGGCIMAGYVLNNGTNYNDSWIIKTDSSGCADSAGCIINGLAEYESQKEPKIFLTPIPVTDELFFKSIIPSHEIIAVSIYNILGEIFYLNPRRINEQKINTASLPSGIYFIEILSDKEKIVKKFVKN